MIISLLELLILRYDLSLHLDDSLYGRWFTRPQLIANHSIFIYRQGSFMSPPYTPRLQVSIKNIPTLGISESLSNLYAVIFSRTHYAFRQLRRVPQRSLIRACNFARTARNKPWTKSQFSMPSGCSPSSSGAGEAATTSNALAIAVEYVPSGHNVSQA